MRVKSLLWFIAITTIIISTSSFHHQYMSNLVGDIRNLLQDMMNKENEQQEQEVDDPTRQRLNFDENGMEYIYYIYYV